MSSLTLTFFSCLPTFEQLTEKEQIKELAYRLKRYRVSAGMTQAELAFKLNTDQSYIGKVEAGKVNMKITSLINYCNALGVDITEALAGIS